MSYPNPPPPHHQTLDSYFLRSPKRSLPRHDSGVIFTATPAPPSPIKHRSYGGTWSSFVKYGQDLDSLYNRTVAGSIGRLDGGDLRKNDPEGSSPRPNTILDGGFFDPPEEEFADAGSDSHGHGLAQGSTRLQLAVAIVKGTVGPAILFVPHGFSTSGWLFAVPMLALALFLFLYSGNNLIECWRHLSSKSTGDEETLTLLSSPRSRAPRRVPLTYPSMVTSTLGRFPGTLVSLMLTLQQFGIVLTYFIFVPANARSALLTFGLDVPLTPLIALMCAAQVPLSWVEDIKRLSGTNMIANCLIGYGLASCMLYARSGEGSGEGGEDPPVNGTDVGRGGEGVGVGGPLRGLLNMVNLPPLVSTFYLFIGTSVLLFEGLVALIIPLQESITDPTLSAEFPSLLSSILKRIVAFYAVFAMSCWSSFVTPNTVLTTSLPPGAFAASVQVAYSAAVLLTFPLQNFPALEIVAGTAVSFARRVKPGAKRSDVRTIVATVAVILLAIAADLLKDSLSHLVSLIGAVFGIPLAFIVPSLVHNATFGQGLGAGRRAKNDAVVAFGLVSMICAGAATVANWGDREGSGR